jgi:hypothetical protein
VAPVERLERDHLATASSFDEGRVDVHMAILADCSIRVDDRRLRCSDDRRKYVRDIANR